MEDGWAIPDCPELAFASAGSITATSGRTHLSISTGFAPTLAAFIAFVRTLLPTIAGLSGLSSTRFQFFNWMSGLLWVLILTTLGYALGKTPVFAKYEDQLMSCLMLLPVVLLVFGPGLAHWLSVELKYGARG